MSAYLYEGGSECFAVRIFHAGSDEGEFAPDPTAIEPNNPLCVKPLAQSGVRCDFHLIGPQSYPCRAFYASTPCDKLTPDVCAPESHLPRDFRLV